MPLRRRRRVSVTIPSLNPRLLADTVGALATNSTELDIEAVVVSTLEARGPGVVWVPETERRGSIAAHALAFQHASGELLINLADDRMPMPGALDVAVARLDARGTGAAPFSVGLNWIIRNRTASAGTSYGHYYPYFHVMTRRSVEQIGGWIDPVYRRHFADADLAMRVWAAGGRCELAAAALMVQHPLGIAARSNFSQSEALELDMATYQGRWRPQFGQGWGELFDDFHIDYPIEHLVGGTMRQRRPVLQR
jgi:GT2 family glycosyltransferase